MFNLKNEILIKQVNNLEKYFLENIWKFSLKKTIDFKKFDLKKIEKFDIELKKYNFLFNKFWKKYFNVNNRSKEILNEILQIDWFRNKKEFFFENNNNYYIDFKWFIFFHFDIFLYKIYFENCLRYKKLFWSDFFYIFEDNYLFWSNKDWIWIWIEISKTTTMNYLFTIFEYLYIYEYENFKNFVNDFWILLLVLKIYLDNKKRWINEIKNTYNNNLIVNKEYYYFKEIDIKFNIIYNEIKLILWEKNVEKLYNEVFEKFYKIYFFIYKWNNDDFLYWLDYRNIWIKWNYFFWIVDKEKNDEKVNENDEKNDISNIYIWKLFNYNILKIYKNDQLWIFNFFMYNTENKVKNFEKILKIFNKYKNEIIDLWINNIKNNKIYEENKIIIENFLKNRISLNSNKYNFCFEKDENFFDNFENIKIKFSKMIKYDFEIFNKIFWSLKEYDENFELINDCFNKVDDYDFWNFNIKWLDEKYNYWYWDIVWIEENFFNLKNINSNWSFLFNKINLYSDNQYNKFEILYQIKNKTLFYKIYFNLFIFYEKLKLRKEIKEKWYNNMFEKWNIEIFDTNKEILIKKIDFLINSNINILRNEFKYLKENIKEWVISNDELCKSEKILNKFLLEYKKIWEKIIKELKNI